MNPENSVRKAGLSREARGSLGASPGRKDGLGSSAQSNLNSENPAYLSEQIITYIGNKRALLPFIGGAIAEIKSNLKKDKITFADVFSGSGVVSRLAKAHASEIYANDLELYSQIINECYLSNDTPDLREKIEHYRAILLGASELKAGFISELYAPKDESDIRPGERVFFTPRNAKFIDTMRSRIDAFVPRELRRYFIAPLLYEASVHNNTGGVFKGFYKDKNQVGKFGGEGENALSRIKGEISLPSPVLSRFATHGIVAREDCMDFARDLPAHDIAYLDPPYNQHPYGSNYFMLNLIASYERPREISDVSGIPTDWNRSVFNQKALAKDAFFELLSALKSRYLLISFNNEGFISPEIFERDLAKIGSVSVREQKYNTYRASRNLNSRNIHVTEYLYIVKKS